jgi:hypothetical protein
MISINASQPAIHSAALGLEGVRSISGSARHAAQVLAREVEEGGRYRHDFAGIGDLFAGIGDPKRICNAQICRGSAAGTSISMWERPPNRC